MVAQTVWREAIEVRQRWHRECPPGSGSIEVWPAAMLVDWLATLEWRLVAVGQAVRGETSTDPRAALVDLIATAGAWVDAMDLRPGPT